MSHIATFELAHNGVRLDMLVENKVVGTLEGRPGDLAIVADREYGARLMRAYEDWVRNHTAWTSISFMIEYEQVYLAVDAGYIVLDIGRGGLHCEKAIARLS